MQAHCLQSFRGFSIPYENSTNDPNVKPFLLFLILALSFFCSFVGSFMVYFFELLFGGGSHDKSDEAADQVLLGVVVSELKERES